MYVVVFFLLSLLLVKNIYIGMKMVFRMSTFNKILITGIEGFIFSTSLMEDLHFMF